METTVESKNSLYLNIQWNLLYDVDSFNASDIASLPEIDREMLDLAKSPLKEDFSPKSNDFIKRFDNLTLHDFMTEVQMLLSNCETAERFRLMCLGVYYLNLFLYDAWLGPRIEAQHYNCVESRQLLEIAGVELERIITNTKPLFLAIFIFKSLVSNEIEMLDTDYILTPAFASVFQWYARACFVYLKCTIDKFSSSSSIRTYGLAAILCFGNIIRGMSIEFSAACSNLLEPYQHYLKELQNSMQSNLFPAELLEFEKRCKKLALLRVVIVDPLPSFVQEFFSIELGALSEEFWYLDEYTKHEFDAFHSSIPLELQGESLSNENDSVNRSRLILRRKEYESCVTTPVTEENSGRKSAEEHKTTETTPQANMKIVPRMVKETDFYNDCEEDLQRSPQYYDAQSIAINTVEKLKLLRWADHLRLSNPSGDVLNNEIVNTIVSYCLNNTTSEISLESPCEYMQNGCYMIVAVALFLKAYCQTTTDFLDRKSCVQLLCLYENIETTQCEELSERIKYFWLLNYPSKWQLIHVTAVRLMKIGLTVTAAHLFKQLKMWPECVDCLSAAGRKEEALQLLTELQASDSDPLILALQGQLEQNPEKLMQAWKASRGTLYRAAKALANYYDSRASESIENLTSALEWHRVCLRFKFLDVKTRFSYGVLCIKIFDFTSAREAFLHVTRSDPENAEAFANLGSACIGCKRYSESLLHLKRAHLLSPNSTAISLTLANSAVLNLKFDTAVKILIKLCDQRKAEFIPLKTIQAIVYSLIDKFTPENAEIPTVQTLYDFFQAYVTQIQHLLPSSCQKDDQPSSIKFSELNQINNAQFSEPVSECVQRFLLHAYVIDLMGIPEACFKVLSDALKHLKRVIVDLCTKTCVPAKLEPFESVCAAIEKLFDIARNVIKLIIDSLEKLFMVTEGTKEKDKLQNCCDNMLSQAVNSMRYSIMESTILTKEEQSKLKSHSLFRSSVEASNAN